MEIRTATGEPQKVESFEVKYLATQDVRLFHPYENDWTICLTLAGERSWRGVRIACAFPFSDPEHYIGLRDAIDKEIGMLTNLDGMDEQSRSIIAEELDRRYFTPKVLRVESVEELYGTVTWQVETDRGPRRFIVRNIRDNTSPLAANRIMMTDTEGNRYEFQDVASLGPKANSVLIKVM